jgi:hypothetical protein
MDLIVSPPPEFLADLEAFMPVAGLPADGLERVCARVMDRIPPVTVRAAGGACDIILDGAVLRSFVRRSCLDKPVPRGLGDASSPAVRRARSIIRRGRYSGTPARDEFLVRMTGAMPADRDFASALSLMLRLFNESPQGDDVHLLLAEKKRFWNDAMRRVAEYSEVSRGLSMEYLMSQRISPPAVDMTEAMRSIELIDRISLAVFGVRAGAFPALHEVSLDAKDLDEESLVKVIRFLS